MKKNYHKIIADLLFLLHILWIVLLVGGVFYAYYHRWYIVYHLVFVGMTLLANLFFGGCPLTWWEEDFRKKCDPGSFYCRDSFVATYFEKFFKIKITARQANRALAVAKIAFCCFSALILTRLI